MGEEPPRRSDILPPMDPSTRSEADSIADALLELADDIDVAGDDDATGRELDEVWSLADSVLGRYRALLNGLVDEDRTDIQRSVGLKVAKVEGLLSRLPARSR